jgi:branched-chain amino acid transport system permease protein
MNYLFHILIMISIYTILSLSLNLPIGYVGLLSLAQAAFYGLGAYAATLLMVQTGINFFIASAFAVVFSAILSFLVSYPSIRLKGDYFILASLAFQVIIFAVLYNWIDVTRGPYGISAIPRPELFGMVFNSLPKFFALSGCIALIVILITNRLYASPFGLVLKAIREDELAAVSVGKNINKFKMLAFAISAGLAAVAGALFAVYMTYIDPTSFTLDESIFILSIVLVGGSGNLRGPVIGTMLMILLPEGLRSLGIPDSVAPNVRQIIYALVLIVLMRYRPQGLAGEFRLG